MPSGGTTVFTLGEGTIARYKVEEVLANTGFKVATGETMDVEGVIAFDADGNVVADESRIAVQAATLRTDSNRRDGYVRNRTLETDTYPEVVFVPTTIDGLPESIADASGHAHVHITGDLTVKDQTREITWDGDIDFPGDGTASGSVAVTFTFDDFGMTKPSVAIVLSVEDEILLELDFTGTVTAR
jgi:polyisoprenoid-binding protein YceI